MKAVIILTLFIITISSYGQMDEEFVIKNYYNLTKKKYIWSPISEEKDSLQLIIIDKILKDTSNHFYNVEPDGWNSLQDYTNNIESITSEFHFVDLDEDNDLDLVYQGMKGMALETELILIFINKSGQYHKLIDTHGLIAHFEKNKQIIIYKYPCCAMITNILVSYTVKTNSITEAFSLLFLDSPLLHTFRSNGNDEYKNIIPKKLKKGKDYEIISGTKINFIPQDSILYPTYIDKNLIGEIRANIVVTEYGKYVDNDGITWLYCKIPYEFISLPNREIKYLNKKIKLFGWVNLKAVDSKN